MNEQVVYDIASVIERLDGVEKKLEGKTVLISGACGFLGSWFVQIIAELNKNFVRPCKVIAIDSFIATDGENILGPVTDPNITFKRVDISTFQVDTIEKVDYIIHAAGIASPIFYRKYPIETIDGMVLGCSNLLKYSVKFPVESVLVFSSSEIYGNPDDAHVPTDETYNGNVSPIGPRSCYDESKRMEEAMSVSYHRIHNVPVKVVRPFNVYGPGMRKTDDRVIPKFMYQMMSNKPITVHRPGLQTRTFCYISDAMTGFFLALLKGRNGNVYNIGSSNPEISMFELASRMKEVLNTDSVISEIEMPQEYPTDQAQRRCPNITKAYEHFGYMPQVHLHDGIRRMNAWAKEYLT